MRRRGHGMTGYGRGISRTRLRQAQHLSRYSALPHSYQSVRYLPGAQRKFCMIVECHHEVTVAAAKRTLCYRWHYWSAPFRRSGCWERCHTAMSLSANVEHSKMRVVDRVGRGGISVVFDMTGGWGVPPRRNWLVVVACTPAPMQR
jgi:hypothetical protein